MLYVPFYRKDTKVRVRELHPWRTSARLGGTVTVMLARAAFEVPVAGASAEGMLARSASAYREGAAAVTLQPLPVTTTATAYTSSRAAGTVTVIGSGLAFITASHVQDRSTTRAVGSIEVASGIGGYVASSPVIGRTSTRPAVAPSVTLTRAQAATATPVAGRSAERVGGGVEVGAITVVGLSSFSYTQDPIPATPTAPATITFTASVVPGAELVQAIRYRVGAQHVDVPWTHDASPGTVVSAWPQTFAEPTPEGQSYPLRISALLASGMEILLATRDLVIYSEPPT